MNGTSKRSTLAASSIILKFGTIFEQATRSNLSKFEKKKRDKRKKKCCYHMETENRLRVGNTPFIEYPVCGSSKNANGTERFRIRTRESLYPLFPVLCDVSYTRVTVQTVKNQTVYSTNSRIPKRLRKNARSIGSYIKILFFSSFSVLQRKSPIISQYSSFFVFLDFVQSSYPFVLPVYIYIHVSSRSFFREEGFRLIFLPFSRDY